MYGADFPFDSPSSSISSHVYTLYTRVKDAFFYVCMHIHMTYKYKCTLYVYIHALYVVCHMYVPFFSFPPLPLSLSPSPSLPLARSLEDAHPHTHTHSWKRHLSGESFEQGLATFTGHLKMVPHSNERERNGKTRGAWRGRERQSKRESERY